MPSIHSLLNRVPAPLRNAVSDKLLPDLLPEGDTAPEFQLQNWDGTWKRLGKHWTVLVFYPGDDTPGCTLQLQDFQAHYAELDELGCQIYAINPAEAHSHQAFAQKFGFEFPVLTDRGGAVARRYQARLPIPYQTKIIRSVYLVNPARKIRLANRGAPSVEAIVRSIQALQQATKQKM